MTRQSFPGRVAGAVPIALASVAFAAPALAQPSYHLVDLGTDVAANSINNHGVVVGSKDGHAVVLRDGVWHPPPSTPTRTSPTETTAPCSGTAGAW